MKKIRDLHAEDFHNVDSNKFIDWKNAHKKYVKLSNIFGSVAVVLLIIAGILRSIAPSILLPMIASIGFILAVVYMILTSIRLSKQRKELGITSEDLREARRK